jgi:hypothetical protein
VLPAAVKRKGIKVRIWQLRGTWSTKEGEWQIKWTRRDDLQLEADFLEPFFAFGDGRSLFLLTESGKLYGSDRPLGGKARMRPLWVNAKRPIQAVIGDADTGRAFAFVPPAPGSKDRRPAYFVFAPKVLPHSYTPPRPASSRLLQPLRDVVGLARVLLADRAIKSP